MLRNRNTKIIATLGPSSSSPLKIHSLFQAGADIFRLNFSHGSHEDHRKRVFHIRQYEKRLGRPIGILGDLQGPKLRIGNFKKPFVILKNNQKFSSAYWFDRKKLDSYMLPSFTKKVFQYLEKN